MKFFYTFCIFLGSFFHVIAHHGAIKGSVTSEDGQSPLSGISVSLHGTTIGTVSDSEGNFIIPVIPAGSYEVTASGIGFKKQSLRVRIGVSDTAVIRFRLPSDILNFPTVAVEADRPSSASSSVALQAIDFELRQKNSSQDLLKLVPGLVIAQHAGGGKAEQIFIRGFDADHGTDVRISVDGMPVNMVSHGHGQGYADLHFVIPETVRSIDVAKGPYFAQYGDFATAGAVSLQTFDRVDQNVVKIEGGMYSMGRALLMSELPFSNDKTSSYIAAELVHNDGYFQREQNFKRYNLLGKVHSQLSDNSQLTVSVSGFASEWDASGQIPERAIKEGTINRFGSIDPTEGGTTRRNNLNLNYSSFLKDDDHFQVQGFLTDYRFGLFSNFTFFARDTANGDQIEQTDERLIGGLNAKYFTSHKIFGFEVISTFGANVRADIIDVQLWNTKQRSRLSATADAEISQQSSGLFVQEEVIVSEKFRIELGLRGDYLTFNVRDRLLLKNSNFSNFTQQGIFSPKINIIYSPTSTWRIFANAGSGFHSNDARGVASGQGIRTLPKAVGAEIGTQLQLFEKFFVSATAWGLDLESELVYVGDEGTTEANGATRRIGFDLDARYQILPWLWADAGAFLSRGRFKDLPDGENFIALAPTFTSTGGISAMHPDGLEASLRYRLVSDRSANENNSVIAKGYFIADAFVGFKTSSYMIGFSVENLFNTQWNEAQFDTESRLLNESEPVSELHFTPGTPINARTSFSIFF